MIHSFLLIGQSNMAGRGFKDEVEPIKNPHIKVLRNGRWQNMYVPVNPDRPFSGICLAESFAGEVNKLPDKKYFTVDDLDEVEELIKVYENMSSYQQSYIADETLEKFKEYLELYKSMKPSEEDEGESSEGNNAGNETTGDAPAVE